jgi:hypothetical protein
MSSKEITKLLVDWSHGSAEAFEDLLRSFFVKHAPPRPY